LAFIIWGIEVGDVKLNLTQMMKAKDTSVDGLTKGIEFLLKKNGVDWCREEPGGRDGSC
jgi:dihydrolipoamide dehydrogenase